MVEITTAPTQALSDGGYLVALTSGESPAPRRLPVSEVAAGVALATSAVQPGDLGTAAASDVEDFAGASATASALATLTAAIAALGEPGAQLRVGEGAPDDEDFNDGDIYFDLEMLAGVIVFYGPKGRDVPAHWPAGIPLGGGGGGETGVVSLSLAALETAALAGTLSTETQYRITGTALSAAVLLASTPNVVLISGPGIDPYLMIDVVDGGVESEDATPTIVLPDDVDAVIRYRVETSTHLAATNPTLLPGEPIFESDTGAWKVNAHVSASLAWDEVPHVSVGAKGAAGLSHPAWWLAQPGREAMTAADYIAAYSGEEVEDGDDASVATGTTVPDLGELDLFFKLPA